MKPIEFTYLYQPPKRYTFQQPKLRRYVEEKCFGKVLNLFAGKTKLLVNEIRVDMDSGVPADYHMKAEDFVELAINKGWKFDTIILDPPYNIRQSRERYHNRMIGSFTKLKNRLPLITNDRGIIISLGYDSVGMSRTRGFEKIAVCLVCHSGSHNDTLCLIEKKVNGTLGVAAEFPLAMPSLQAKPSIREG